MSNGRICSNYGQRTSEQPPEESHALRDNPFANAQIYEFYCACALGWNMISRPGATFMSESTLNHTYTTTGVLFVHGFMGHASNWVFLIDELTKKTKEAAHQTPGTNMRFFTLTIRSNPRLGIRDHSDQLNRRILEVECGTGVRIKHLVGHSMGGLVIRQWLLDHGVDHWGKSVAAERYTITTLGSPLGGTLMIPDTKRESILRPRVISEMKFNSALIQEQFRRLKMLQQEHPTLFRSIKVTTMVCYHDRLVLPLRSQIHWFGATSVSPAISDTDRGHQNVEILNFGHIGCLFSRTVVDRLCKLLF